ncbi:superinfection immunity protein [Flavobacterium sp. B17]|uniref:superinfection immunity protein n=1 Tax=Flavobacterium sp. B17 TaxID=95618 RepID=UPI000345E287|nr:superinfection immunity protein [Flavobacterium sp. B17]
MIFLTLLSISWQHILIVLLISIPFYFLPTLVAYRRKKSNVDAIFTLNLFLGWSVIGWAIALFLALSNKESNQQNSNIDQLTKLKALHDKGAITDEEFLNQKERLLR